MAENRFSKGVKAAKERTAELEANKKKQEQEVAQNKIEELPEEPTETKFDISKEKEIRRKNFLHECNKHGEVRKVGEIAENVSIEGAK